MINHRTIRLLPRDAVVVNTARGDLVDDDALIAALRSGRIAAAGLDVYAGEPALDPRYLGIENAFLMPHLGTATREARRAMTLAVLEDIDRALVARLAEVL